MCVYICKFCPINNICKYKCKHVTIVIIEQCNDFVSHFFFYYSTNNRTNDATSWTIFSVTEFFSFYCVRMDLWNEKEGRERSDAYFAIRRAEEKRGTRQSKWRARGI